MKFGTFYGRATKYLSDLDSKIDTMDVTELREAGHAAIRLAQSVVNQLGRQRNHAIKDTNIVLSATPSEEVGQ